ncbi:MAG: alpha-L-fucosidase [Cyclobacteriaceae bacterium]
MKNHLITLALILSFYFSEAQEKFKPTEESFKANYEFPVWFQDAKFGIWSHWGPQAVPRMGDHFARRLYWQNSRWYDWFVKNYGHPSEKGFKDLLPDWKAEKWNPDALMKLYKKAGARYFVSMGVHHDNFFLWDSKIHKWNSANMGPKKDVVGLWQAAAKKEGLYFGVSEHLGASYTWFQDSHRSDNKGPLKGVRYDGANPEYWDFYHKPTAGNDDGWYTIDPENHQNWLTAISELIDLYNPDLLYSDGGMAFDQVGMEMISHYYNNNLEANDGKLTAIYTCKSGDPSPYWVLDFERGKLDGISKYPWQTDSSIADWYYDSDRPYKKSPEVIHMLVDIVSKNGNLLLNIVQTPEGDLDAEVVQLLEDLAIWFEDNGEGIHETRPWKIYGEGPSTNSELEKGNHGGIKETDSKPYTHEDFRFTQKGNNIYAFCMNKGEGNYTIKSFGKGSDLLDKKIKSVKLSGSNEKLKWKQSVEGLIINPPSTLPEYQTISFKITM